MFGKYEQNLTIVMLAVFTKEIRGPSSNLGADNSGLWVRNFDWLIAKLKESRYKLPGFYIINIEIIDFTIICNKNNYM